MVEGPFVEVLNLNDGRWIAVRRRQLTKAHGTKPIGFFGKEPTLDGVSPRVTGWTDLFIILNILTIFSYILFLTFKIFRKVLEKY